ncbi:MAG: hypothetical protein AAF581_23920, partial [Planctomycetota bacterium]
MLLKALRPTLLWVAALSILCAQTVVSAQATPTVPAPSAPPAPSALAVDVFPESTEITWLNNATYDAIHIFRDADPLAVLGGEAEEYADDSATPGYHTYEVVGVLQGQASATATRRAFVQGQSTDLIWSPLDTLGGATDSAQAILAALAANARTPLRVTELPTLNDLAGYESVWVTLGTFPYNHVLRPNEADTLERYSAAQGAVLYMEGGDTWFDDPSTPLHAKFGAVSTNGGDSDLSTQIGIPGVCLIVLDADYVGENSSIDRLIPGTSGQALFRNDTPAYDTVVLRSLPQGGYAVAASHEFGGLQPLGTDRAGLMELYLDCLELRAPTNLELRTIHPARGQANGGDRVTLRGQFTRQTQVYFG